VTEPIHSETSEHNPLLQVSPREVQVLEMTSQGLTNDEIARRLNVTTHAVKFHLASIYRKLGVANRTEAAVVYLRSTSIPS
jgi:two-component system, NarL family, nitrate/nitrite response regulator NarL